MIEEVGGIHIDYDDCTCRNSTGWCWGCGHDAAIDCPHSCLRRGFHGWCTPQDNAAHRDELGYGEGAP